MLGSHRCFPVLGCNLDLPLEFGNAKRAIRINYCNYKDVSTGRFRAPQLSEKQSDLSGNNREDIPRHLKYLEFQCLAIWLQGWSSKSDFNLIPVNLGAIFGGTMGILQCLFRGNEVQLSVDVAAQDEDPGTVTLSLVFSLCYPTLWISSLSQECVALLFPPQGLSQAHQSFYGFKPDPWPSASVCPCHHCTSGTSLDLHWEPGRLPKGGVSALHSQFPPQASNSKVFLLPCSVVTTGGSALPTFQGWSARILGQDWFLSHGICAVIPEPHPWPLLSIKALLLPRILLLCFFLLLIKRIKEVENFSVLCLFAKSTQLAGDKEGSHWKLGENFLG